MAYVRRAIIDGNLQCSRCKEWLSPEMFWISNNATSGRQSACIKCIKSRSGIGEMNAQHRRVVDGKQCCTICEEWKPEDQFERSKNCRNGRGSRCNVCSVKRTNAYASRSPEVFFKNFARRHARNLVYRRSLTKRRRHLFFENCVTPEFLVNLWNKQNGRCAITGIAMTHKWGGNPPNSNVSIDRIDSNVGYVPENVQLVCKAVNLMKNAMDQGELEFWCMAVLEGKQPSGFGRIIETIGL